MDKLAQFFKVLQSEQAVTLATAAGQRVAMRAVSPVLYQNQMLFFTAADSLKYRQLQENPHCCIAAGMFFAEAVATFLGATMLDKNRELRDVYSAKFPDAFAQGVPFGGRSAEFVLLKPTMLRGWAFENGVPTVPFELAVE